MKKSFLCIISLLLLGVASCYAQHHAATTGRKDFLRGLINFSQDTSFVQVDSKYTPQRAPFNYLNREAYQAFIRMWEAAKNDGIKLVMISGARTFQTQNVVWARRWNESQIAAGPGRVKNLLRYSALPGCSRHHWGTDLDLNANRTDYWRTTDGKKIYQWLCENAHKVPMFVIY